MTPHFDLTITLGSIISSLSFIVLTLFAWRDMNWRVKNLEQWRVEHIIDSDSRDAIIKKMDNLLTRIETLIEERNRRRT